MSRRRIKGLVELQKKLAALPAKTRAKVEKAALKGAQEIAEDARRNVPVKTGKLRDSIGAVLGDAPATKATQAIRAAKGSGTNKDPNGIRATVYAGNDDAFYALWVEWGTQPATKGGRVGRGDKPGSTRKSYRTHPGTPAQPFFGPAWRAGRKRAIARLVRAARAAVKEVAAGNLTKGNADG